MNAKDKHLDDFTNAHREEDKALGRLGLTEAERDAAIALWTVRAAAWLTCAATRAADPWSPQRDQAEDLSRAARVASLASLRMVRRALGGG